MIDRTHKLTITEHEPLARYTSWRIGGNARFFANAPDEAALREGLEWANTHGLQPFVLGGGTNLLIRDSGFDGLVLRLRDQRIRVEELGDEALLWAAGGAPMAGTARRVSSAGFAGLEWAEGLPGTIGGATFGNAGCYGGDIAGVLRRAWLLADGRVEEWPRELLGYRYRSSALKRWEGRASTRPIVLAAEFALRRGSSEELRATMARIARERKGKTPWGSSCGSVFKNPPASSAGVLIDQAGLKGTRSGPARISERHANYIVNEGGASSDDILRLIELARGEVFRRFGVELELEIQILGQGSGL
jgi:UDP-N-acetylmuramate dehydrogenase